MQAPKGSRGRGRGRGASRGGASLKSNSDDEHNKHDGRKVRFAGSSASTPFVTSAVSRQVKAQAAQLGNRNNQQRSNKTSDTARRPNRISSNGRRLSSPLSIADQTWRDPTIEGNASYTKRMSELYQTVCFPFSRLLTRGFL